MSVFRRGEIQPVVAVVELALAGLGAYLLWAVGVENGMLDVTRRALKSGAVLTHYTGITSLDRMLAVLVAFFVNVTQHPAGRPLMAQIGSLLAVSNSIIYFAAASSSSLILRLLSLPILFGTQAVGAAVASPLYYALLLLSGNLGRRPINARGWLQAFALPFFGLAAPVVFPVLPKTWTDRMSATWQLWPLWTTLLLPILRPASLAQSTTSALTLLGFIGALAHLASIAETVLNWRHQVPIRLFTDAKGLGATFIACDIVVTYASTLLFVAATARKAPNWGKVLATTIIAGPAAALAWALADSERGDSKHE